MAERAIGGQVSPSWPRAGGWPRWATLIAADDSRRSTRRICPGPNGTYFTDGKTGSVRQIFGDGKYADFAAGFQEIRGVAYDAENGRIFAADHDPGGVTNRLQIIPVD